MIVELLGLAWIRVYLLIGILASLFLTVDHIRAIWSLRFLWHVQLYMCPQRNTSSTVYSLNRQLFANPAVDSLSIQLVNNVLQPYCKLIKRLPFRFHVN